MESSESDSSALSMALPIAPPTYEGGLGVELGLGLGLGIGLG